MSSDFNVSPIGTLHVSMIIINLISNNRSLDQTLLKIFLEDMLQKLSTAFYHPTALRTGSKNSHSAEEINVLFSNAVNCQDYIASLADEWSISVRHIGGMIWKGDNWSTHEKNLSQYHFWQLIPHRLDWNQTQTSTVTWHSLHIYGALKLGDIVLSVWNDIMSLTCAESPVWLIVKSSDNQNF